MSEHLTQSRPIRADVLLPSLTASGVVGAWEWDVQGGCVYYDEGAAILNTGDRSLAGKPLAGPAAIVNVHPEDRGRLTRDLVLAEQTGDLLSCEYRIITPDSEVCNLLSRARIQRGAGGRVARYCGVLIDITESRIAAALCAGVATRAGPTDELIVDVADLCLEARAAIERHGSSLLLRKADALLFAVGRELARTMTKPAKSGLH